MKITKDTKQRIQSFVIFCTEFYKIFMASFLVYSIPIKCVTESNETYKCSIYDIYYNRNLYNIILQICNLITFITFCFLYYIEIKRESWCIEYLDVDILVPSNFLDTEIERYPKLKKTMYKLNNSYYKISYISMFFMILNFIVSGIYIIPFKYDFDSYITLSTFFMLILNKLYNSYNISLESIKNETCCSSYLTTYVIYNNIDLDYVMNDSSNENRNFNKKDIITSI